MDHKWDFSVPPPPYRRLDGTMNAGPPMQPVSVAEQPPPVWSGFVFQQFQALHASAWPSQAWGPQSSVNQQTRRFMSSDLASQPAPVYDQSCFPVPAPGPSQQAQRFMSSDLARQPAPVYHQSCFPVPAPGPGQQAQRFMSSDLARQPAPVYHQSDCQALCERTAMPAMPRQAVGALGIATARPALGWYEQQGNNGLVSNDEIRIEPQSRIAMHSVYNLPSHSHASNGRGASAFTMEPQMGLGPRTRSRARQAGQPSAALGKAEDNYPAPNQQVRDKQEEEIDQEELEESDNEVAAVGTKPKRARLMKEPAVSSLRVPVPSTKSVSKQQVRDKWEKEIDQEELDESDNEVSAVGTKPKRARLVKEPAVSSLRVPVPSTKSVSKQQVRDKHEEEIEELLQLDGATDDDDCGRKPKIRTRQARGKAEESEDDFEPPRPQEAANKKTQKKRNTSDQAGSRNRKKPAQKRRLTLKHNDQQDSDVEDDEDDPGRPQLTFYGEDIIIISSDEDESMISHSEGESQTNNEAALFDSTDEEDEIERTAITSQVCQELDKHDTFGMTKALILSYFKCLEPEPLQLRKTLPSLLPFNMEEEFEELVNNVPSQLQKILRQFLFNAKEKFLRSYDNV